MFNGLSPLAPRSTFSIGSILTGISKTLNIANKAIPIYQQIKPMIGNIGPVVKMVRGITSNNNKKEKISNNNIINSNNTNSKLTRNTINTINNPNYPVFFLKR